MSGHVSESSLVEVKRSNEATGLLKMPVSQSGKTPAQWATGSGLGLQRGCLPALTACLRARVCVCVREDTQKVLLSVSGQKGKAVFNKILHSQKFFMY